MVTALAVVLQTFVGIPPLLTDHSLRIPFYLIPVFYKIQFQFSLRFSYNFLKTRKRTARGTVELGVRSPIACGCGGIYAAASMRENQFFVGFQALFCRFGRKFEKWKKTRKYI